jgi:hypothetical protein
LLRYISGLSHVAAQSHRFQKPSNPDNSNTLKRWKDHDRSSQDAKRDENNHDDFHNT